MTQMKDYLSPERVSLGCEFADWEQAVRFAGDKLIEGGCINAAYREAMVDMVKRNGAYIVIMPGVALAHARPEGNVSKNSIALLTLKKGIDFGHPQNDPVRVVFAIAACSNEEHLDLFKAVAKFLCDESNVDKLLEAASYNDVMAIGGQEC